LATYTAIKSAPASVHANGAAIDIILSAETHVLTTVAEAYRRTAHTHDSEADDCEESHYPAEVIRQLVVSESINERAPRKIFVALVLR
jgi:hypothetical protein